MSVLTQKIVWYLKNPAYYPELIRMIIIKIKKDLNISKNTLQQKKNAFMICEKKAVDTDTAILKLTGNKNIKPVEEIFKEEFAMAKEKAQKCPVQMGGQGNLKLLYYLNEYIKSHKVIETGVAYGWSSLIILLSLQNREGSMLVSTDKPYPGLNNENYVGFVVPEKLKKNWKIVKYPDRRAISIAIKMLKTIDLCHYDSDKTYEGRSRVYPRLWKILCQGGIFISDDIGDNMAFIHFCEKIKKDPIIIKVKNNYVGILIKS